MSDTSVAADQLCSIYERWCRLEEDKKAVSEDLKELFKEARGNGFDGKALRIAFNKLAKSESESAADRATREMAELYIEAIEAPRTRNAREAA